MDLDGADNPWADAPPSNSASREHLPSGPLPVDTFAAAFPTPSPTASASNSFTPPTSSSSYSAAATADPTAIPLPASATSPTNPTLAQDDLPNAFASLALGKDNGANQSFSAADDTFASAFDMSAPVPTSTSTSAADPFGFGAFDVAPSSAPAPASQTSAFASSSQSNDADALFGDFGAPTQTPAAKANDFAFSSNASNDAGAESDGFGDFADFTTGDANAATANADDDDFGDFGDFESTTAAATTDLAPPQVAPVPATATPPQPAPAAPLAPILQSLVSGASLPVTGVFDLQSYLAASADPTAPASTAPSPVPQLHIPLVHTAPDGTCSPRVSINPVFAATAGDGYDAILRLAEAPLFDEHISTRIRWRKCLIKKMFQAALEMPVDWDDKGDSKPKPKGQGAVAPTISTSTTTATGPAAPASINASVPTAAAVPSPPSHTLSPITPLPDLATLTALANLTEDDLRARTDDDLAHIQGVLASAVPGLHAQINYYLDAREQLALDAEMHNKMISVLVQQAQKSHGRFAKKGSPPKRK